MSIENIINDAWENRDQVNPSSEQSLKDTINKVIKPNSILFIIKKSIRILKF